MDQPQPLTLSRPIPVVANRAEAMNIITTIAKYFDIPLDLSFNDMHYIREIVYSVGNREGYNFLGGDYKTPELIPTLEGLWDKWTLHPSAKEYINKNIQDYLGCDDNPIGHFVYDDDDGDLRFRAVIVIVIDDPIPSVVPSGNILYPEVFETDSIFTLEAWLAFYMNFASQYAGTPTVQLMVATKEFFERNPFNYDSL